MRRALNWGKWLVKKNNLAHLTLRIQNVLAYGARNTSISVKLSKAGKRAVQSHIVSHVKDKLRKRTKRSNDECHDSIESGKPGGE